MAERDWAAIASEYIEGEAGLRTIAERHGIPPGTLFGRARREFWAAQRREARAERRLRAAEKRAGPLGGDTPAAFEKTGEPFGGEPAASLEKTGGPFGGEPAASLEKTGGPFGGGTPAALEKTGEPFRGEAAASPEKTGRPFRGEPAASLEKDAERIFRVTDKLLRRAEELLDGGEIGARELGELMRALKSAKEIKMLRSALDEREQQARVRALEEKNEPPKREVLRIEFSPEAEAAAR